MQIIPSILASDEKEFLRCIRSVDKTVSMIHIDVADGVFVSHTTWADPEVIAEELQIDCELHLMVKNPLEVARQWEAVDQVKRVFAHYESDPEHIADILVQIYSYGWNTGVVLNLNTPSDVLKNFAEEIDAVMCMGVVPGAQCEQFTPTVLKKIKTIKQTYPNLFVELDGGVHKETLPEIVMSGVDAVTPGSAIFHTEEKPSDNVVAMRARINRLTQKN